jgi:hypothetical protein
MVARRAEAFQAARAADPTKQTQLFYNDFGAEEAGSDKSETVYQMVASMVKREVPIDGVGLQVGCTPLLYDRAALARSCTRPHCGVLQLRKLSACLNLPADAQIRGHGKRRAIRSRRLRQHSTAREARAESVSTSSL